jgi:hypothetical protein
MKQATITRSASTLEGTFGTFSVDGHTWYSLELPDLDNHPQTSCIPKGTYVVKTINSPKHGNPTYQVMNVPRRSMVEIHSANFAGSVVDGKKSQLLGCIALGKNIGSLEGQKALLDSKKAMAEFMAFMNNEDFNLTIK